MGRVRKAGSSRGQKNIADSVNRPPSNTLIIPARELVQIVAKGVPVTRDGLANESKQEKQQDIMMNSTISKSRPVDLERELGRWVPDEDDPECPELDNPFDGPWNRGWDQFEVNETLFGVKSTFDEDLYTTKLDRGPQTRELEREALKIAREIEGEDTQDLHLAEERGIQLHGYFEMDEETRFSSVFRGVGDSGYDEKENLLDSHNVETFGDAFDSVISKSFTGDDGAQVPSSSSSVDEVQSSLSISASHDRIKQLQSDPYPRSLLALDGGSRVHEVQLDEIPAGSNSKESEKQTLAKETQVSNSQVSIKEIG